MRRAIELIKNAPQSEIVGGIIFAIGFPIIFCGVWVMTPA